MLEQEKELVVKYCKKLITENLTTGTSGNISIYNRTKNLVAISPSGIEYNALTADDISIVNIDGNIVEGKYQPSSELPLHLMFYKNKNDANAVVHCHSLYACVLAAMHTSVKAYHYMIGDAGTDEIPCAPYVTFGTQALADETIKYCKNSRACILANHGQIVYGKNIKDAFNLAISVEFLANLQYHVMSIGNIEPLTSLQMEKVLERFKTYGSNANNHKI